MISIAERAKLEAEIAEVEAPEFVPIADMDDWDSWWRDNGGAVESVYGIDRQTAFGLACNCELVIGGGAAPLFRIGFVD